MSPYRDEGDSLLGIRAERKEEAKCNHYRLLKFTPGCVQRHCLRFNTSPPLTMYSILYVLDTLYMLVCGGVVELGWKPYTEGLLPSVCDQRPNSCS
jgi:hypothetical protein